MAEHTIQRGSRLALAALLLTAGSDVLTAGPCASATSLPTTTIQGGTVVNNTAYPQKTYAYQLSLAAGQFLGASVDQRGIDLILQLYGPGHDLIVEADADNGAWGPERVVHIAKQTGTYELCIGASQGSIEPAPYRLKVYPVRMATSRDISLADAQMRMAKVRRLEAKTELSAKRGAAEAGESVAAAYRQLGDSLGLADASVHVALLYFTVGDYERALGFYLDALPLMRSFSGPQGEAKTLGMIGSMYKFLGEPARAKQYLRRALLCCGNEQSGRVRANILNNLAAVEEELGNPERALDLLQQSLPLRQASRDLLGEGTTLNNIGAIQLRLGRSAAALEFYSRALPVRRLARDQTGEAQTLHNMGIARSALGDHESGIAALTQALQISRSLSDIRGEADSLYGLARVESARGELQWALERIREALVLTEIYRDRMARQDLKASFTGSIHKYYEFCVDTLMTLHQQHPEAGYDKQAFETSERARARSLLDVLAASANSTGQQAKPGLRKEQLRLQSELAAVARHQTFRTDEVYTQDNIDTLISSYRRIEAELLAGNGQRSPAVPLSRDHIQERLPDVDTLLLEYSLGQKRSFVWAVSRQTAASYVLPDRKTIEQAAQRMSSQINRSDRAWAGTGESRADAAVHDLANIVLRPVWKELASFPKVIVVADGALHYVPFGVLSVPESEATEPKRIPLINAHEVTYTPSGSAMMQLGQAHPINEQSLQRIAIFADPVFSSDDSRVARLHPLQQLARRSRSIEPRSAVRSLPLDLRRTRSQLISRLPFSRREADEILGIFSPDASMRALGFEASRRAVFDRDLLPYSILHFATHGLIDSTHPELSGIALSMVDEQGHPQDGFLTMADINSLRLSARLVVLSACETALGKEVRGEGLIGLTQAFMHAGAANVLATLWKVDDVATAELMKQFYTLLVTARLRPADALRRAQLQMQQTRRWTSPYYWGGFVLQGAAQ